MLADLSFLAVFCFSISFSFNARLSRLLRSSMSNDLHKISETGSRLCLNVVSYIVRYAGGKTSAGSTLRLAGCIESESIEPRLLLERAILVLRPSSTSAAY